MAYGRPLISFREHVGIGTVLVKDKEGEKAGSELNYAELATVANR